MNEKFVKCIYETIVEGGKNIYQELYENTEVTEKTTDYWRDLLHLYGSFDDKQKKVFIGIIKQTMIDTISSIFGVLDGSSALLGGDFKFEVKINGICTEENLQDTFLGFIEDNII